MLAGQDLAAWKQYATPELEDQVLAAVRSLGIQPHEGAWAGSEPTRYATAWNVFNVEHPLLDRLRQGIRRSLDYFDTRPHHVRLWLNVIRGQGTFDWHCHNTKEPGARFGYVSITSEPSQTIFRLVNVDDAVIIDNRDGFAVWSINTKDGDLNVHKTTPMVGAGPRISLAWDVTPSDNPRVLADHAWRPL